MIAILVLLIVKKIPALVQGLLSGSPSLGGGDMMGQMKSAASTAVKTAAAVKSGGMTALAGAGKAAGAMSAFSKAAGDMQDWGGHGSGVGGMVQNAGSFANAALGKGAAMMGQGLKAAGSAIKNRNPYTQGRRSAINALAGPNGLLTSNAGNIGSDKNGQPITAESLLDSLNPNNATSSGGSGGGASGGGGSSGGSSGTGGSNGGNPSGGGNGGSKVDLEKGGDKPADPNGQSQQGESGFNAGGTDTGSGSGGTGTGGSGSSGGTSNGGTSGGGSSKKRAPYEPVQGKAYKDGGERLVAPTLAQTLGIHTPDNKEDLKTVGKNVVTGVQNIATGVKNAASKAGDFVQEVRSNPMDMAKKAASSVASTSEKAVNAPAEAFKNSNFGQHLGGLKGSHNSMSEQEKRIDEIKDE